MTELANRDRSLAARFLHLMCVAAVVLLSPWAHAQEADEDEASRISAITFKPPKVEIVGIDGHIVESQLSLDVEMKVTTYALNQSIDLVSGDVVMRSLVDGQGRVIAGAAEAADGEPAPRATGMSLGYDMESSTYRLTFATVGEHRVHLNCGVRAGQSDEQDWREAAVGLPLSDRRPITLRCDRDDLEVDLPGAVRVRREVAGDDAQDDTPPLTVTGLQGLRETFVVRWKPTVRELDAELVMASEANTLVSVNDGTLRVDSLFVLRITQGHIQEVVLDLPEAMSVTQVRGAHIQDWRVVTSPADAAGVEGPSQLVVALSLPQTGGYVLQVVAEQTIDTLPTEVGLPVIAPPEGIRASGHLAVGTDSAIALVVGSTSGLTQIDQSAMPRLALNQQTVRTMPGESPSGKAFFYSYAASPYSATLSLDHVVAVYDAEHRVIVEAREDDLVIETQIGLDIRDAPIRAVDIVLPQGFAVVGVSGAQISDDQVQQKGDQHILSVQFAQPVIGQVTLAVRLEAGDPPVDAMREVSGMQVLGASNQRGYVVVAVADGLAVNVDAGAGLRRINTASTPFAAARAQVAYRIREAEETQGLWSMTLAPTKKPAPVRAEGFQLVSIGEGVAYGNAAINYYITGSPVDELWVHVDPAMEGVQFVGSDVRRYDRDEANPSRWRVKLQRRVMGDYNLGVSYYQRYTDGDTVTLGGVYSADAQTQTTYVAVSSRLDLELAEANANGSHNLISIEREELPADYRMLITTPLLRSYKAVGPAGAYGLSVDPLDRGELTPVIIELAQAQTQLALGEGATPESTTRVRYRIKNARSQFMRLKMPQGATGWAVHIIDITEQGPEVRRRVNASFDPSSKVLMIPLPRPLDPNSPLTIEVAYGQVHPAGVDPEIVALGIPQADVASTYESWTVDAPEGWTVSPTQIDGAMQPSPRRIRHGNLGSVLEPVATAWAQAWDEMRQRVEFWSAGLIGLAAVVLIGVYRRTYVLKCAVLLALVMAAWVGATAAQTWPIQEELRKPDHLSSMTWTRVIRPAATASANAADHSTGVDVRVVPLDAFYGSASALVSVAAFSLIGLIAGGLLYARRGWQGSLGVVLIAAGLAGILYAAGRSPGMSIGLANALTWGLPALLAAFLVAVLLRQCALRPRPSAKAVVAAALIAFTAALSGGCAQQTKIADPPQVDTVLDRITCDLVAEDDSMAIAMSLAFHTEKPMRFPLIAGGAIMLDSQPSSADVQVIRQGDAYFVEVKKAGRYTLGAEFLRPLALPNASQARSYAQEIPTALTNQVTLTIPDTELDVLVPTAILSDIDESQGQTTLTATLGPRDGILVYWRPRDRRRELEQTIFYGQVRSLLRLSAGSAQALHDVSLEIAQGQVSEIMLELPENMTVTQVAGPNIGAWRFDPQTHRLEVRLTSPATGTYQMFLATQLPVDELPYDITAKRVVILNAQNQRTSMGIVTSPAVYITMGDAPPAMNGQDFSRDATVLMAQSQQPPGAAVEVRYACRLDGDQSVQTTVQEVLPEIRSTENASYVIEEERLVYSVDMVASVTKAGVFSLQLLMPEGYDIDALVAGGATHWDESEDAQGRRWVTLHFPSRVGGQVPIRARLSQPIETMPQHVDVPHIEVAGSLKHTGQLTVAAAQGVRLSVESRDGATELNPLELGIRAQGVLALRLLRPAWELRLSVEQIEPRITADVLHVAAVADGVIRHTAYLRYSLQHAGTKTFLVRLPADAIGVRLVGPGIARRGQVPDQPGLWEVELSAKWFDQPYPLAVQYDTRFDPAAGAPVIEPVTSVDSDLQHGYLAVLAGSKVEVRTAAEQAGMVRADARTIPRTFGAGDLSEAALCYRCPSASYGLALSAKRLDNADLVQASVDSAQLTTVVTPQGGTITRAVLELRVAGKQHLETRLPAGGVCVGLRVNGRAAEPSVRMDVKAGEPVYLVPLESPVDEDARVLVDLVYTVEASATQAVTQMDLQGPRFDLPLRDIQWAVYAPEEFDYDDFTGNVQYIEPRDQPARNAVYTLENYDTNMRVGKAQRLAAAQQFQQSASTLADLGEQRQARAALEQAMYFSLGDQALNEDARVQFYRLSNDQAVVGLIGSRQRLRELDGGRLPPPTLMNDDAVLNLSQRDLQSVRNALSQQDNENLAQIAGRFMTTQTAATARPAPLVVEMPLRGRVLHFARPIQAQPNAPLTVSFKQSPKPSAQAGVVGGADRSPWLVAGALVVLLLLAKRWMRVCPAGDSDVVQETRPANPSESAPPVAPSD